MRERDRKLDEETINQSSGLNMPCHHLPTELSSSPPGPYHQEPYVSKPEERFKAPPILPPHLLQVILNKDTGISVSAVQTLRGHTHLLSSLPAFTRSSTVGTAVVL